MIAVSTSDMLTVVQGLKATGIQVEWLDTNRITGSRVILQAAAMYLRQQNITYTTC